MQKVLFILLSQGTRAIHSLDVVSQHVREMCKRISLLEHPLIDLGGKFRGSRARTLMTRCSLDLCTRRSLLVDAIRCLVSDEMLKVPHRFLDRVRVCSFVRSDIAIGGQYERSFQELQVVQLSDCPLATARYGALSGLIGVVDGFK